MATQVFQVSGLTCDHCVGAVTDELSTLPGVSSVRIDLVPGAVSEVTVDVDEPLGLDAVRKAVDEAGYELVG